MRYGNSAIQEEAVCLGDFWINCSAIHRKMPKIDLVFYKEDDGKVPMEIWLDSLPKKVTAKCEKRLELLAEMGHFLRRPIADYLLFPQCFL
jgi:hypothetical protein